jgi:hypothetical protein
MRERCGVVLIFGVGLEREIVMLRGDVVIA